MLTHNTGQLTCPYGDTGTPDAGDGVRVFFCDGSQFRVELLWALEVFIGCCKAVDERVAQDANALIRP